MRIRFLALSALVASSSALAGPPMITNDPDTPGPGIWEINLAATGAFAGGDLALDAPDLDLNRGVGDRIQLSLHTALAHAMEGGRWSTGAGDIELGVRYRFLDAETSGISVAVQPLYVNGWSASARRRGLASAHPEWVLPVQLARPFGSFDSGFEISRHFVSDEADAWQAGAFLAHHCRIGECLVEVNSTREDGKAPTTALNVGARHALREDLTLMGSLGSEVAGPDRAPLLFYVGLQYLR